MADAAPADPGVGVPAVETPPAAARAQPQPETTPPVATVPTPEAKGPIPFDRHEAALKNARLKTEQEVTQRFQQQYAPHVEYGQRIQADPVGTLAASIAEVSQHPVLGPQMISALARVLGSRRNITPEPDQEPGPDLQTGDGIQVYSAEQLAKREAWLRTQIESAIEQRITPLQQREQQWLAQDRLAQAQRDAHENMSKVLAPYAEQPEFVAHKPAIAAKVTELLAAGHDPATALGVAYATILRETVLPSRTAQSQQSLVAQAVAKSTGSTTAPGASPSAPASRPTSWEEAYGQMQL